jgi:hypothetical protein
MELIRIHKEDPDLLRRLALQLPQQVNRRLIETGDRLNGPLDLQLVDCVMRRSTAIVLKG